MQRFTSTVVSATVPARRMASVLDDERCPVCGAVEETGGCFDPKDCGEALARRESRYARALVHALDTSRSAEIRSLWAASTEALDLLGIGLAVCDPSGRVLGANRTAKQTLQARDALQLTDSGELRGVANDAPSLADIFQGFAHSKNRSSLTSQGDALLIPRASGRRAMTLVLRRVRGDSSGVESAQVLVMMLDGTQPVVARDPDLQQLFGFTPGETKLANLLMAGKSMAESCDDLGICPSTGCSHLRKMFKKTGSHRQGELVALLLRSIGLVRNGGPAAISEGGRSTPTARAKNDVGFPDLIQVDVDTDL